MKQSMPLFQGGMSLALMILGAAAWDALQSIDFPGSFPGSYVDSAFAILVMLVMGWLTKRLMESSSHQEERLLSELASAREDRDYWHAKFLEAESRYQAEHSLRVSLEKAGIVERRDRPDRDDNS